MYDGVKYPTSENAYQAAKSLDPEVREIFVNIKPGEAKKLGQTVQLREDWEQVKIGIMEQILLSKFQSMELVIKLVYETGIENDWESWQDLIEGNDWGDTFWGVCEGVGENHLGKLLEELRSGFHYMLTYS